MRRIVVVVAIALALIGCSGPKAQPPVAPSAPVTAPAAPTTPAEPVGAQPKAPEPKVVAPTLPSNTVDVAWAPDSRRLAVLTDTALLIIDGTSNRQETWPVTVGGETRLAGWRHDGQAVYVATPRNALLQVQASGTVKEVVPAPQFQDPKYPVYFYYPSPAAPVVIRQSGGKFQLIGGQGAWEGSFSAWSPAGKHFFYTSGQALRLVDLASGQDTVTPVRGMPVWHPKGDSYLLVGAAECFVVSLKGGAPVKLPGAQGADWSADGSRIVYVDDVGFWTINADGTNRQSLRPGRMESVWNLTWLVQDELVFLQSQKTPGVDTLLAPQLMAGGKVQPLPSGPNGVGVKLAVSPDRRRVAYIILTTTVGAPGQLALYP